MNSLQNEFFAKNNARKNILNISKRIFPFSTQYLTCRCLRLPLLKKARNCHKWHTNCANKRRVQQKRKKSSAFKFPAISTTLPLDDNNNSDEVQHTTAVGNILSRGLTDRATISRVCSALNRWLR